METTICNICNKTYKNIHTLKAHYNSNMHKQNAVASTPTNTNISSQPTNSTNSTNTTRVQVAPAKTAPVVNTSSSNPTLNSSYPNINFNLSADPDDLNEYEYGCISCNEIYKNKEELEVHQQKCPIFTTALILSLKTNMNLGLCIKAIYNNKLYEAGADRISIHIKLMELDKLGGALDFSIRQQFRPSEPSTAGETAANTVNAPNPFINGVEGNWVNFREVRPLYEENMIIFRQPEYRNKLLNSGRDCFKTLVDIVYSQKENMNWYILEINKNLAMTITPEGDIKIVKTNAIFGVLIYKYIDFIINMFITAGLPVKQIYDDLGISVASDDSNTTTIYNTRIEEYDDYIHAKIAGIESQAVKNINLFDSVRHKLIDSNKNVFKFDQYTIEKCNIIFTYKQSQGNV